MYAMNSVSMTTTAVFVALVAALSLWWPAIATYCAESQRRQRVAAAGLVFAGVWVAVHGGVVASGILQSQAMPPPAMIYLFGTVGVVGWLCLRGPGRAIAQNAPLAALVGFQAFRLPLELVLHAWAEEGALPIRMTFEGANFDILTGISALVVAATASRLPQWVLWAWNIVGLVLLVVVVGIAVLSAPLPLRQFFDEPAVVLVFHVPYTFIASVLVMSALAGHILVFMRLRSDGKA